MFFYLLVLFLFKLFVFSILLLLFFAVGLRLWLEPVKGICKCKTKLHGKVALITGGNTGIGLETAKDLARRGARVIIASRDNKKSEAAVTHIIQATGNSDVEYRHLDLSKFCSIRKFCDEFNATVNRLDILVNNAGCAGIKSRATADGIEPVMQINYLGPFLLTNLLLKKVTNSKPSRIVIVSSYAVHFNPSKFNPDDVANLKAEGDWTKYCNTKLCNVLWAKALSKRLPQGVTANSLHPGIIKTDIFNKLRNPLRSILLTFIQMLFKTPKEGAQTTIHLCVAPELEDTSGKFYLDCKPDALPKQANDEELVEKVWKESVRLTGNSKE